MENLIVNKIQFPPISGLRCHMMPFIQGDSSSLPEEYKSYSKIIDENYLEKGEIGFLTIDESFVNAGESQRGYNNAGINRNVHIEVGRVTPEMNCWGGGGSSCWGSSENPKTLLADETMLLIANSIPDSCRIWNTIETSYTKDGDLSAYIDKYPEDTGILLKSCDVAKISIFTPHESLSQKESGYRQFFRIIGKGVTGREDYFTVNPLLN